MRISATPDNGLIGILELQIAENYKFTTQCRSINTAKLTKVLLEKKFLDIKKIKNLVLPIV